MDKVLHEKTSMHQILAPGKIAGLRMLVIHADPNSAGEREVVDWLTDCLEVTTATPPLAIALLRKQAFDAAIVVGDANLDVVSYLPNMLAAGPEDLAIVVVGEQPSSVMETVCFEAEADAYFCKVNSSADRLYWTIHRAVERKRLTMNARQWTTHQEQASEQHHQAAIHQIRALRSVLLDGDVDAEPPSWLVKKLDELLRAYVVSMSGDLAKEARLLFRVLAQSGVTLHEALMAHSVATERLVIGLGNRPAWHILGRSQMMAYELVMHFAPANPPLVTECSAAG